VQRALLLSLVATSYLLLAGGPRWTLAPLLGLAVLGIAIAPRATLKFSHATRPLDLAALAVVAGMVLQLLPMPAAVVSWLSPQAQVLRAKTRFAVADAATASWLPLSIDADATVYALGTFVLGFLSFLVARGTFSSGGTRQFCRVLGWLAAIAAIVAITQKALMPGVLMGVIVPEARNANPLGAFLNRNHFAGWLLMCTAVSAGYLTAHFHIHPAYRERLRGALTHFVTSGASLSGIAILITTSVLLMTLSRSAAAGLGAAAVTAGWLGRHRIKIERTNLPALSILAGVSILLVAAFVDFEGWIMRLQSSVAVAAEPLGRLTIWRESLPMVRDFPLTGTGAGTFGTAMAQYQQSRVWVGSMQQWSYFNNAHSHYVQLAVEGGLLLAAPVGAALVLLARLGLAAARADKGEMFWMRVGAAAGLAGMAVQSVWEVAMIMPANAVLAGTLAGLLLHRRDPSVRSAEHGESPWTAPVAARRA
jgi:putative inorganic carbon (HCO3(-)) transporter